MKNHALLLLVYTVFIYSCVKDDIQKQVVKSNTKQITEYVFLASENDVLNDDLVANINEEEKQITVTVPFGTERTSLQPSITVSEKSKITPDTGVAQDFTTPVLYKVAAEDGSIQEYNVVISEAQKSEKRIISFAFMASQNNALQEDILAVINESEKTIQAIVPYGTAVDALTPKISITPGTTITPDDTSTQDFSNTVNYTVTAQDNSSQAYTVNVVVAGKEILIFPKAFQRIENIEPGSSLILQPGIHGEIVFKYCKGTKDGPITIKNASTGDVVVNPRYYREQGNNVSFSWRFIESAFIHIEGNNNPGKCQGIEFREMQIHTHEWTNSMLVANCRFIKGSRAPNGNGVASLSIKVPYLQIGEKDPDRYANFVQEYAIVRNCYFDEPSNEAIYIGNTYNIYHLTKNVEITNVYVKDSGRECIQVSNALQYKASNLTLIGSGLNNETGAQMNMFQVGNSSGSLENFVFVNAGEYPIIMFTKDFKIRNGAIYNAQKGGIFLGKFAIRYPDSTIPDNPVEISNVAIQNGKTALVEVASDEMSIVLNNNSVSNMINEHYIQNGLNTNQVSSTNFRQNIAIPSFQDFNNSFFDTLGYKEANCD
ncbi:DUF5018 domain-containing protein [Aquimarina mytili]|uniref:DUF5018 domain-containing protein n=1 Tax=Aquimarina mytili TaxID=874423 RepID=A0A936ZU71_9FLAO|nr:hypothetical protein [Aquimarina mytili]MBL0685457.1 hypothetical protein [Aquimarina mytili]